MPEKRKVRVEFRKNREKTTRHGNLTRHFEEVDADTASCPSLGTAPEKGIRCFATVVQI